MITNLPSVPHPRSRFLLSWTTYAFSQCYQILISTQAINNYQSNFMIPVQGPLKTRDLSKDRLLFPLLMILSLICISSLWDSSDFTRVPRLEYTPEILILFKYKIGIFRNIWKLRRLGHALKINPAGWFIPLQFRTRSLQLRGGLYKTEKKVPFQPKILVLIIGKVTC